MMNGHHFIPIDITNWNEIDVLDEINRYHFNDETFRGFINVIDSLNDNCCHGCLVAGSYGIGKSYFTKIILAFLESQYRKVVRNKLKIYCEINGLLSEYDYLCSLTEKQANTLCKINHGNCSIFECILRFVDYQEINEKGFFAYKREHREELNVNYLCNRITDVLLEEGTNRLIIALDEFMFNEKIRENVYTFEKLKSTIGDKVYFIVTGQQNILDEIVDLEDSPAFSFNKIINHSHDFIKVHLMSNHIFCSPNIHDKFVIDLFHAMGQVSHHYIHVPMQNEGYAERIFAYELYHQLRKIIELKSDMYPLNQIYLNGEQPKGFMEYNEKKNYTPDMVLHGSYNDVKENAQYWAAEIKMATNPKVLDDVEKLDSYCNGELNFNCGILIVAGTNVNTFTTQHKEELLKLNVSSKLVVLIYDRYEDGKINLYCDYLHSMISNVL